VYHDVDATGFGYKPTQIPQMDVCAFPADARLADVAAKAFAGTEYASKYKLIKGRIASGDQFISDTKVKQHIKDICDPACVEMEGAAIAHACWINNIPFVVIRSMSDTADDGVETLSTFNEKTCAEESASIVLKMMEEF
jgi:adenosylhomocysteine nucleosidase